MDYINYRRENESHTSLEKLSAELNAELAEGQESFDAIAADERRWIAEGVNLDQTFAAKYYDSLDGVIEEANRQLATEPRHERSGPYADGMKRALFVLAAVVAGIVAFVWVVRIAIRRMLSAGLD